MSAYGVIFVRRAQESRLAANGVLAGFSALTLSFDEEPGEFRWVITAPRQNEIELSILEFPELRGGQPDAEGRSLFASRCRPIVFAKAVADAARRVLEAHGESGYQEKWNEHPFPTALLIELVMAIEQDGWSVVGGSRLLAAHPGSSGTACARLFDVCFRPKAALQV